MNWGYKILMAIVLFIAAMGVMIYIAYQQSNEMMDSNYYEKEMKYQHLIDAANNLNRISTASLLQQDAQNVKIQLPANLHTQFEGGTVELIKLDDQSKDVQLPLQPDTAGFFSIEKNRLVAGNYKVRIQWNNGKQPYYKEQSILIQK